MRRFTFTITICVAVALLALAVPEAWAGCPGGGGGPTIRPTDNSRDPSLQWEAWWNANQELFFGLKRKKFVEEGADDKGSTSLYGDQLRREAIAALKKALTDDPERDVRLQAAVALGKIGGSQETEALLNAMKKDSAREVKITSHLALGLLKDPKSADELKRIIENQRGDEIARHYSCISLGWLGIKDHIPVLEKVVLAPRDNKGVRLGAMIGLGKIKDKKSAEIAIKVLHDKKQDKLLRSMAAHALARQDSKLAIPALEKIAKNRKDDKVVTQAVALALGHHKTPDSAKVLQALITKTRDDYTQAYGLISLARQKDKKNTDFLIQGLKKAPNRVRSFVAVAVGIQGDTKALPAMQKWTKKYRSNRSYFAAGNVALAMLGDKSMYDQMVKYMKRNKKDVEFTPYIIAAAGLLGEKKAVKEIIPVWEENSRNVQIRCWGAISLTMLEDAKTALKTLTAALPAGKTYDRRSAAIALGELASRDAVKPLIEELGKGKNAGVRANCARAIGNLMDKSLEYGSFRELSFVYTYRVTNLNRSLRHIYALP